MAKWQLQEAKARLSDVVKRASSEGPQSITLRGNPVAVVLSHADYARLRRPRPSFVELMRSSPLVGVELRIKRTQTLTRDVAL
jgi:antitoxin Phd